MSDTSDQVTEAEEIPADQVEGEETESDDEDDEPAIEWKGERIKVDARAKEAYDAMVHDYKNKGHEIGEARRAVEKEQKALAERTALQEQVIDDISELKGMDKTLAEYQAVTQQQWRNWRDQDQKAADDAWFAFQQLKDARSTKANQLGAKVNDIQTKDKAAKEARSAENARIAALKIKDYSPTKAESLRTFAKDTYGFTDAEVSGLDDPRILQLLDENHRIRQGQNKARIKTAPVVEPVPVAKAKGTAKATAAPQDNESMDAWSKKFYAQRKRYQASRH